MVENEVQWLSIAELRGYFGVSNALVHKWIDKHGMPAHKMGSLWKFNMDEVDEW
ncbi:MAG: excisionase family DNA-binding protein, partial [Gammaproteobacteria bacterium]|nr:excisionase family DNA-binding protein [Gammaproteobacteria bacterium]